MDRNLENVQNVLGGIQLEYEKVIGTRQQRVVSFSEMGVRSIQIPRWEISYYTGPPNPSKFEHHLFCMNYMVRI